ncbi:conserved hypothetical protein [Methylobacterium sp. 4-46]|nr:DUF4160 domain-containing protein [Methylobacterium nodulans]ACA15677.1 conserved hypothetical protein [Methylobacterium sp. 4-46]WFT81389.1 DUF4160 domain-containing protein [Methylobacterium nodulans]
MPTVQRFAGFTIYMYADDHPPPHFHVRGPGFGGVILLSNLEMDRGVLPPGILDEAVKWASRNKDVLYEQWRRLNDRD